MNVEALTQDLNTALDKHGITGQMQTTIAGVLTLAASQGGRILIGRAIAGAALFAVDDHGSACFSRSQVLPRNAALLNELLAVVKPGDLADVLEMVVGAFRREIGCSCKKCKSKRGATESARSAH